MSVCVRACVCLWQTDAYLNINSQTHAQTHRGREKYIQKERNLYQKLHNAAFCVRGEQKLFVIQISVCNKQSSLVKISQG